MIYLNQFTTITNRESHSIHLRKNVWYIFPFKFSYWKLIISKYFFKDFQILRSVLVAYLSLITKITYLSAMLQYGHLRLLHDHVKQHVMVNWNLQLISVTTKAEKMYVSSFLLNISSMKFLFVFVFLLLPSSFCHNFMPVNQIITIIFFTRKAET